MSKTSSLRVLAMAAAVVAAVLAAVAVAMVDIKEAEAAFPGQNGRIAFESNRITPNNPEGDFEIFTARSNGTDLRQLTSNTKHDFRPAYSPDGQRIAYSGFSGADYEIYTIPASGGTRFNVTDNATGDYQPAYSPDGTRIAYVSDGQDEDSGNDDEILTIGVAGGTPTPVTSNVTRDRDPAYSPNGNRIAYTGFDGTDQEIFTVPVAGGEPRFNVTDNTTEEGFPDYSPDGARIAYTSFDGSIDETYTIPATGGAATNLTNREDDDFNPAWSPDGTKIAVGRSGDIYTMNASDGSNQANITNTNATTTPASEGAPDWQPLVPLFVWPSSALTIDWRDVLTIPGRLFLGPGNPMPGQRVYLEERPAGSEKFTLTPGAEAITTEDGSFRFEKVGPSENTDYRVRFEGDEAKGIPSATSSTGRVNVRVLVSGRLSTNNLKLGESLTISGAVAPAHEGKVTLIVRRNGKAWTEKSSDLIGSRFNFRYKPGAVGEYTVVARYPTHADHLGNTGPKRSFVVP